MRAPKDIEQGGSYSAIEPTPAIQVEEARTSEQQPKPAKAPLRVLSPKWIKKQVKAIKGELTAVYYATIDRRTPIYAKILPWLAILYAACPIDLVPDFIPVLGFLDDVLIVPLLLWLGIMLIPKQVMEDARKRAQEEPFKLTKNWLLTVGVLAVWLLVVEVIVYQVAKEHELVWLYMLIAAAVVVVLFGVLAFFEYRKIQKKAAKEAAKQKESSTSERGPDRVAEHDEQDVSENTPLLS